MMRMAEVVVAGPRPVAAEAVRTRPIASRPWLSASKGMKQRLVASLIHSA